MKSNKSKKSKSPSLPKLYDSSIMREIRKYNSYLEELYRDIRVDKPLTIIRKW